MRRLHRLSLIAALGVVTACDAAPVTFNIAADSVIAMTHDTAGDGSVQVICEFALAGRVEGPDDGQITMRGGRVRYVWWQSNTPAATYEWSPDAAARFWADSVLPAGELRASNSHGFAQSDPGQPLRGTVTFDYLGSDSDTLRTTNAWNFYCS
jgi:hypothetical protein